MASLSKYYLQDKAMKCENNWLLQIAIDKFNDFKRKNRISRKMNQKLVDE